MKEHGLTTRNLKIAQVREDENLILVVGAVPGSRGGYVELRPSGGDS